MSPVAPKRPCRQIGCPALVESGIGYCEKHGGKPRSSARPTVRGTTKERGYGSRDWKPFRSWVLRRRPMCEASTGCNQPATEVHHIVKIEDEPSRRLDETNVQCLCSYHHRSLAGKGGKL